MLEISNGGKIFGPGPGVHRCECFLRLIGPAVRVRPRLGAATRVAASVNAVKKGHFCHCPP